MNVKNLGKYLFSEDALELFKRIWLSCVIYDQILINCKDFLMMNGSVSLKDTFEYIKTGTSTIAWSLVTKCFNGETIEKKDIIYAFSDRCHQEAMSELFITGRQDDFWHREFDAITYLFSHVLKPVLIVKKDPLVGSLLWNREISLKLINLYSDSDIDEKKIQLIHFGAVVGELDWSSKNDKKTLARMCEEQEEIFSAINIFSVNYEKLLPFYERNFGYYNSLRS